MEETIEREMTISHDDFYRILPKALNSYSYQVQDNVITVSLNEDVRLKPDTGSVENKPVSENCEPEILIFLARETTRNIASLSLPLTNVTFQLKNVAIKTKKDFFNQFDRSFHRGGG